MEKKAKVDRSAAACYLVSIAFSAYIWATDGQFCDESFFFWFEQCRTPISTGNGVLGDGEGRKRSLSPHLSKFDFVIAIFTELTQIYDIDQDDDDNHQNVEEEVEKKFRKPLYGYLLRKASAG